MLNNLRCGVAVLIASTTSLIFSASAQATAPSTPLTKIGAVLDQNYSDLERLYQDLHAHPEVGFQEQRTAAILAQRMRKLGFTVTEGVGKTGIVAVLRNGDGPTVMIRAEMDGLPMEEKTGLPYASRARQIVEGKESYVAHSCGHDVHMTWWIATAQALVAMRDSWKGTLVFVGQPAEEPVSGAKAMIADGLFTHFPKPDFGFGAHVANFPAGTVFIKPGASSAASDSLEITFHGRGGHGSIPSATIDPIVIGAQFVNDVQTVISREKDALAFGVVTVGAFQAGSAPNIIPDEAVVKVNLRSHTAEVRKLLLDGVERTAKAAAQRAKAPEPTTRYLGGTAAVINDPALAKRMANAFKPVLADRLFVIPESIPPAPSSEDFSEFIEAGVPSVFFGIGSYDPAMIADYAKRGVALPVNHSPFFQPQPGPSIRAGATVLTLAVLEVAGVK